MDENGASVIIYLVNGFLDGGKTSFIQKMLETPNFNTGKKTLLLVCEEGEEEYSPDRFCVTDIEIECIENESEFTCSKLENLANATGAERIICEYNGMWQTNTFYSQLPEGWIVFQSFFIADSSTIVSYNENMRQMTYDKLKNHPFAVFNRIMPGNDCMPYHKMIRTISSKARIVYEFADGAMEFDNIEDPLPYEINATTIEIHDEDYAVFYRDCQENPSTYMDKTVCFKAFVLPKKEGEGIFFAGRHVMVCCANDIQFQRFPCAFLNADNCDALINQWAIMTGYFTEREYGQLQLEVAEFELSTEPENPVAIFN